MAFPVSAGSRCRGGGRSVTVCVARSAAVGQTDFEPKPASKQASKQAGSTCDPVVPVGVAAAAIPRKVVPLHGGPCSRGGSTGFLTRHPGVHAGRTPGWQCSSYSQLPSLALGKDCRAQGAGAGGGRVRAHREGRKVGVLKALLIAKHAADCARPAGLQAQDALALAWVRPGWGFEGVGGWGGGSAGRAPLCSNAAKAGRCTGWWQPAELHAGSASARQPKAPPGTQRGARLVGCVQQALPSMHASYTRASPSRATPSTHPAARSPCRRTPRAGSRRRAGRRRRASRATQPAGW